MRQQRLAARSSTRAKTNLLLGALLAAALLLPSLAIGRPGKVVVVKRHPRRTVVVVSRPAPRAVLRPAPVKKVWVRGHWVLTPLGWRVWVPGHWELVR